MAQALSTAISGKAVNFIIGPLMKSAPPVVAYLMPMG